MKKSIILIISLVIASSVMSQQDVSEKHLRKFCEKFAKAIESGKPEKCLRFFDDKYVKEQHDIILKGNTLQFVSEFVLGFGQLPPEEAGVDLPVFSDISDVKFVDLIYDADGNRMAAYVITLKNGNSYKMHAPIVITGPKNFGFRGAMG